MLVCHPKLVSRLNADWQQQKQSKLPKTSISLAERPSRFRVTCWMRNTSRHSSRKLQSLVMGKYISSLIMRGKQISTTIQRQTLTASQIHLGWRDTQGRYPLKPTLGTAVWQMRHTPFTTPYHQMKLKLISCLPDDRQTVGEHYRSA